MKIGLPLDLVLVCGHVTNPMMSVRVKDEYASLSEIYPTDLDGTVIVSACVSPVWLTNALQIATLAPHFACSNPVSYILLPSLY